jgi:hypothetical protein
MKGRDKVKDGTRRGQLGWIGVILVP